MERFARLDWVSIFLSVSATLLGVIVLYGGGVTGEELAQRKLLWLVLCVVVMLIFANVNYQLLGSFAPIIYATGIVILLLVLVPFIGKEVKGARSWIRFFGLGFQPAEFMKLVLVITLSKYLVSRESEIGKLKELIIPAVLATAADWYSTRPRRRRDVHGDSVWYALYRWREHRGAVRFYNHRFYLALHSDVPRIRALHHC